MNVTIVINNLTHYHILFDYIKLLHTFGHTVTTILVKKELANKEESIGSYSKIIRLYDQVNKNVKDNQEKKSIGYKEKKSNWFYLIYFVYLFKKHFRILKRCTQLYIELKPDFAIISSDRYTDFDLFFSKVCIKNKKKVLVVGIDYFYVDSFEPYFRSNPNRKISTIMQRFIALLFPSQVFTAKGIACLFYPPHLILNLFFMNSLPSRPYLSGSRFITKIFVDGEATKNKFIEMGVSDKKIQVTGLLEHDLIAKSLNNKTELYKEFDIKENKYTVVMALPQGWEHHLIGKDEHFAYIEKIIEIIKTKNDINLILSLHPKMSREHYVYLEAKYNLKISTIFLRDFICLADLYIATFSSTVLWSALLNIPCIVMDIYELNYDSYREMSNVYVTNKLCGFKDFYESYTINKQTKTNVQNSNRFGRLDNKATDLFLKLINEDNL